MTELSNLLEYLLSLAGNFSYPAIFLLAIFCGYLLPLPEEVALLFVGYVAGVGPIKLHWATLLFFLGVLLGDNLLFYLSYRGSRYTDRILNKLSAGRLSKYRGLMERHIGKAIFFLRFIVGLRSFGPVIAGSVRIAWREFFWLNFFASALHVVLFTGLGYWFHNNFLKLVTEVEVIRHILFFSSTAMLTLMIAIYLKMRQFSGKKNPA